MEDCGVVERAAELIAEGGGGFGGVVVGFGGTVDIATFGGGAGDVGGDFRGIGGGVGGEE